MMAARWTSTLPWLVIYVLVLFKRCWGQGLWCLLIFCCHSIFVLPQELKAVLLGSSLSCFTVEWRNQGFTFSETHDLRYGIVQKKVVGAILLKSSREVIFVVLLSCTMSSVYLFLGWSLWSPGLRPSLCSKDAAVWKHPQQWYWPSVSYSLFQSCGPLSSMCPIVNTRMLFTHINSHQGMLCRHCDINKGDWLFTQLQILFSGS